MDVLEGLNVLVTISGKKNIYLLSNFIYKDGIINF